MRRSSQGSEEKSIKRVLVSEKLESRRVFALGFQFNPAPGTSRQVIAGFEEAGRLWQDLFSDNVKVVVDISEQNLGPVVIGSTLSNKVNLPYVNVRNSLFADARSVDDAFAASNLSTNNSINVYMNLTSDNPNGAGSLVPYVDADGGANNTTLWVLRANARALGLLPANDPGVDGSISFNTATFNFDFDRSDGITPGTTDFVFVAAHEIGHLLGFVSGVDVLDFVDGQGGRPGPFGDDALVNVTVLDLFRQSTASVGAGADLDFTADTRAKYFSLDGASQFGAARFATGVNNGDGNQASHWFDNSPNPSIGFMDPNAAVGEFGVVTGSDLTAFDVIGWDLAIDDRFEDNNTVGKATPVGSDDAVFIGDLTIGSGDQDFFRYTAHSTGRLNVTAIFRDIAGDIDMRILDQSGTVVLGFGNSVADDEHIVIPVVSQQTYYIQVLGFPTFAVNKYSLEIENFSVPTPVLVDLSESSDSGRDNNDDLTNDFTPTFLVHVDLDNFLDPDGNGVAFTPVLTPAQYATNDEGAAVELFLPSGSLGIASPVLGVHNLFTITSLFLVDGVFAVSAAVRINDGAKKSATLVDRDKHTGRGDRSVPLLVTIDTLPPAAPTLSLDPATTDSGIPTSPSSYSDRVTKVTTPGVTGNAEPASLVRLVADGEPISANVLNGSDVFAGQVVAAPADARNPNSLEVGVYRYVLSVNLNDPALGFPVDGQRQIGATAEDLAGNVSRLAFLDILVDTTPAKVTAVNYSNGVSVFATKPQLAPSPSSTSLLVTFSGGPTAAAGLSTPAVDVGLATDVRNYKLVGDHNGTILVGSVALMGANPSEVTVRLNFSAPLPDDRFTLTLLDAISDASGNMLDGDSQASSPGATAAILPSGNGLPGGNFQARFTVDSRPELGAVGQGLVYVDINGNAEWDPTGSDNDATNRDFVFQFGTVTDGHFAGNFSPAGAAAASGFDKLGVYGKVGPTYSFLIDTNDDGVGDVATPSFYQVNAIPVAGNFNAAHPGDEIGMFDGAFWYLDLNGNNAIEFGEKFPSDFTGIPLVGNFDGIGGDDLATYRNDTNTFYFDLNQNGTLDATWAVRDTVQRFGGLAGFTDRPLAGDINLDGIDDIGLWTKNNGVTLPANSGEAFFWVSDRTAASPALVFDSYSPAPLGNDLFMQFSNENSLPVFGNFDPPIADVVVLPTTENYLHRASQPLDVNGDNVVTPLDALVVINALNSHWETAVDNPVRAAATFGESKVDTSGDAILSAMDALLVINALNLAKTSGEGEANTSSSASDDARSQLSAVDYFYADFAETLSVRKRR